jgi:small-conductance mechanosensitive channel
VAFALKKTGSYPEPPGAATRAASGHMTGPPRAGVKARTVHLATLPFSRDWLNSILAVLIAFVAWRLLRAGITKFYARRFVSRVIPRVSTYAAITASLADVLVLYFLIVELLHIWRVNVAPALWSAGVVGIVIGVGAQTVVRDVLTGAFYLFEDIFDVGDAVELTTGNGVVRGTIDAISLRQVRVVDERGYVVSVPYGNIMYAANATRLPLRLSMEFSLPLQADVGALRRRLTEVVERAAQSVAGEESQTRIDGLAVSLTDVTPTAATFRVDVQVRRAHAQSVAASLRELIARELQAQGLLPAGAPAPSSAASP